MNKSENRYFKTAVKMDEALISLLEKKSFEYVTVKEVCAAAEVNRSTFYLHYETIGDLLDEAINYINEKFLSYFQPRNDKISEKIKNGELKELNFITPEYLQPYLHFVSENKSLFSAALRRPQTLNADKSFQKMFKCIFAPILERYGFPEEHKKYIIYFYIKGIMGIIEEWLENDCKEPPNTISEIIMKCIVATK